MSAWPFGQTSNATNDETDIASILNNYFETLNKIENDDSAPSSEKEESTDISIKEEHSRLNAFYIEEVLGSSELLNELNRQNNTLLDFICFGYFFDNDNEKVPHLQYLIDQLLISIEKYDSIMEKENSENENTDDNDVIESGIHKANIISEIFALDIWIITDELVKNEQYLTMLWSILYNNNFKDENSPITTIFLKINENLLFTKPEVYLEFIKSSQKNLVDDILKHINNSLIVDFFLKIIGTDKFDNSNGMIKFIANQNLIEKCLLFLDDSKYTSDIQNSVGDFLKTLISISANAPIDDISIGPNELTRKLASPNSIDNLIRIILNNGNSALSVAISIVIELIRKNNSDYDQINLLTMNMKDNYPNDRDPIYLGYLLAKFTENLDKFVNIIVTFDNSPENLRQNQLNESFIPLGFERFKIVELIAELLHCSNMGLMNSKRAPRIAKFRDDIRVKDSLSDSIDNLTLHDNQTNNKTNDNEINNKKINDNDISNNNNNTDTTNENNNNKNINNDNDVTIMKKNNKNNNVTNIDDNGDEMSINDNTNNANKRIKTSSNNEYDFFSDDGQDDEVDESFDIPYANEKQNLKLRTRPTIGDYFKIILYDNQILPKLLELFLKYPWNNFWHNVIFDIIQQIFNGRMDFSYNSFLVYSLFDTSKSYQFILDKKDIEIAKRTKFEVTNNFILKGYKESYKFYESNNMNLGYMGHIVLIAEEIVKFSKLYKVELISPDIFEIIQEEDWKFYSEQVLNDTRLMYAKILGGGTYVDDGNGNIVPQFPDPSNTTATTRSNEELGDNPDAIISDNSSSSNSSGGSLVNIEALEEQLTTESDLHDKLRAMLITQTRMDIDKQNEENGVIILGPPPT